jgi:hypothetical protein
VRKIEKELQKFSTSVLVAELQARCGVKTKIAEPYQKIKIKVEGPAIILVVND